MHLSNFRSHDVHTGGTNDADLRIGEVARRTGSTPEVLRVWERRYGVLRPARTSGGFRLYSEDDVARVLRMRELLDRCVGTADAARAVVAASVQTSEGTTDLASARGELVAAIVAFDEPSAQAVLDRLLDERTVESVMREVVLPVLADVGNGWERGTVSVAQEHFGANLFRGRLWRTGAGGRAASARGHSSPARPASSTISACSPSASR
jgi:DNA-binding transcriptional MerR regulator